MPRPHNEISIGEAKAYCDVLDFMDKLSVEELDAQITRLQRIKQAIISLRSTTTLDTSDDKKESTQRRMDWIKWLTEKIPTFTSSAPTISDLVKLAEADGYKGDTYQVIAIALKRKPDLFQRHGLQPPYTWTLKEHSKDGQIP